MSTGRSCSCSLARHCISFLQPNHDETMLNYYCYDAACCMHDLTKGRNAFKTAATARVENWLEYNGMEEFLTCPTPISEWIGRRSDANERLTPL